MSNKKRRKHFWDDESWQNMGAAALIVFLFLAVVCGISWILTCGLIWLICLCFSLPFKLGIATGIWLLWFIFNSVLFRG